MYYILIIIIKYFFLKFNLRWARSNFISPHMVHSRFARSQWDTSLQINAVSHWLGLNIESALSIYILRLSVTVSNRSNHICSALLLKTIHRSLVNYRNKGPVTWIARLVSQLIYTYIPLFEDFRPWLVWAPLLVYVKSTVPIIVLDIISTKMMGMLWSITILIIC